MTNIDIQVSRSKVKVKGHASLLHIVQLITQERFADQKNKMAALPLIGRDIFDFSSETGEWNSTIQLKLVNSTRLTRISG